MVSSAPGTEAFKQDFTRWETLHRELTLGLERLAQAAADAGDHDLFDLARVRRLRRLRGSCLPGQCQRDRSRE
jgi:hypothetical protein